MRKICKRLIFTNLILGCIGNIYSQSDTAFRIFQFPADQIPRIDGNADDWGIVPNNFNVGADRLTDTRRSNKLDTNNINIKVRVGWVNGMDKLYFLCEIYDNYWHFERTDLHHDIFELVVDGDQSGGPLIEEFHPIPSLKNTMEGYFSYHGVHAQNYHIYIPAVGQDWTLAWGSQPWIKELPYANAAYSYDFKHGEPGKLILEFWITPFDYAGAEGPERAVKSILTEGKNIGICWAVIDYDEKGSSGFWNLSATHEMYGDASQLKSFKLMPTEGDFAKKIDAQWSFRVMDMSRKVVSFNDKSIGKVTSWKWDFGDGESSEEQHPVHTYNAAGKYIVTLTIKGPDGQSRRAKVWDVALK